MVFCFSTCNLGCTWRSPFFFLMKRLISALNLRFAYVIMAATTEEAINSPKCSSVAVTLKCPANFNHFLSDGGQKKHLFLGYCSHI